MSETILFRRLADCLSIDAVVRVLDEQAQLRAATSATYCAMRGGRLRVWLTDVEVCDTYRSLGLERSDPMLRRASRPSRPVRLDYARLARGGPDAAFYRRALGGGLVAALHVPDQTLRGAREMAMANVYLHHRPDDLTAWMEGPGRELQMMAAAALERIRELRASDDPGSPLTAREAEVLELVARGLRPAAIAGRLGISTRTVEFHLLGARDTLDAPTRDAAVARAAARGWIEVG